MERRAFVRSLGHALLAVPMMKLVACVAYEEYPARPGSPNPPPRGGGTGGDAEFTVGNVDDSGHLHEFEIKCSHFGAGAWTYTATGPHTHQVTLSGSELDAIAAGDEVTVRTTELHPHTWLIRLPQAQLCDDDDGGGGGGDDPGDPGDPGDPDPGVDRILVANDDDSGHSHSFTIRCEDGDGRAHVFIADGPHTHEVAVSGAELDRLFAGQTITVETFDLHPHVWVLSAPSTACQ